MSSGSRIVIDPDGVRRLATRLRGGASIYSNSGRMLAGPGLPTMSGNLTALVSDAISGANATLQDLAVELIEDALQLEARAAWAELGGGAETAWLIPGLRRYPALPHAPTSPIDEVAAITDEQLRAGQQWAVEMLDGMDDSGGALDEGSDPRSDEVFEKLVDVIETYAGEIPVKALGDLTLAAAGKLEAGGHAEEAPFDLGAQPGIDAGGGAIGSVLSLLLSSPTGWGFAGCLVAGGLIGSFEGPVEDG